MIVLSSWFCKFGKLADFRLAIWRIFAWQIGDFDTAKTYGFLKSIPSSFSSAILFLMPPP